MSMQRLVYYIVHWESGKRIRYYKTQTGARIAARNRNRLLGFTQRISKEYIDVTEYELYSVDEHIVKGTYCIVEDYIETEELYEYPNT